MALNTRCAQNSLELVDSLFNFASHLRNVCTKESRAIDYILNWSLYCLCASCVKCSSLQHIHLLRTVLKHGPLFINSIENLKTECDKSLKLMGNKRVLATVASFQHLLGVSSEPTPAQFRLLSNEFQSFTLNMTEVVFAM